MVISRIRQSCKLRRMINVIIQINNAFSIFMVSSLHMKELPSNNKTNLVVTSIIDECGFSCNYPNDELI